MCFFLSFKPECFSFYKITTNVNSISVRNVYGIHSRLKFPSYTNKLSLVKISEILYVIFTFEGEKKMLGNGKLIHLDTYM